MTYVVFETATSRIVGINTTEYATEAAAKSARTRLLKIKKKHRFDSRTEYKPEDLAVAELGFYRKNIEKMVERTNMMSGKKYMESINTPNYCSPSSEAYWSM
jgi:hypothetical protein